MREPGLPLRYAFDEVVRVVSLDPTLAPINGERAVVVGRTEPGAPAGYSVFVYSLGRVWDVEEADLETTGEFAPREAPPHAVRVRVDVQGRGVIAGARVIGRESE